MFDIGPADHAAELWGGILMAIVTMVLFWIFA